ncbi:uncharacterized protein [Pagrus major]|uniref:uncharacterized protein n=1 Tax=Pagrus major TaxID=143350 RepID=UPI003CC8678A
MRKSKHQVLVGRIQTCAGRRDGKANTSGAGRQGQHLGRRDGKANTSEAGRADGKANNSEADGKANTSEAGRQGQHLGGGRQGQHLGGGTARPTPRRRDGKANTSVGGTARPTTRRRDGKANTSEGGTARPTPRRRDGKANTSETFDRFGPEQTLLHEHLVTQPGNAPKAGPTHSASSAARGSGRRLTVLLLPTLRDTEEETPLGVSGVSVCPVSRLKVSCGTGGAASAPVAALAADDDGGDREGDEARPRRERDDGAGGDSGGRAEAARWDEAETQQRIPWTQSGTNIKDRGGEVTGSLMREGGDDTQQRAAGRTGTLGCCSEDKASVSGTRALPTELPGHPPGLSAVSSHVHRQHHVAERD